jgi:hypothetical protein
MTAHDLSERLHRLVKLAIDNGEAATVDEAEAIFRGYRLAFSIGPEVAADPMHQAALVTGVALARRVFLGGVTVTGAVNTPLQLPMPLGSSIGDAVVALGGSTAESVRGTPLITVGGQPRPPLHDFHVRTTMSGWRGGIVRAESDSTANGVAAMPLAAMLSAAIAVNEAFLYVGRTSGVAGRRSVGLSLWSPASSSGWLDDDIDEPTLQFLPSRLWIIGLGHLGQAFLWALGLLPYSSFANAELVLQDVDFITPSSESTCILTDQSMFGMRKSRAMAVWAERRGFSTSIYERRFDEHFRRQEGEPQVALCGIDNALGRRALDTAGFGLVVEAGLGRGYQDFNTIRTHTLPGPRSAAALWPNDKVANEAPTPAAYQDMLRRGELDKCGVTLLANKAVGAPFVGAVAACLCLSEILRLLHGGKLHNVIEMDLRSVEHRAAIIRKEAPPLINPGYVSIA